MGTELDTFLQNQLIAMADDELILGQRDSEWCGQAPILEEDIAFANLALDEIGHARAWYSLAAGLSGEDTEQYPDRMVFSRAASNFSSMQLVELPNGDWAFSMLRQYLFDAAETVRLAEIVHSRYTPLAETAVKIQKEELYHYRHTHAWVKRLGLGTEESHRRMQHALDELWQYTNQMWQPLPGEDLLVAARYLPPASNLVQAWLERIVPVLQTCELNIPEPGEAQVPAPRLEHTPYLDVLVAEMQALTRLQPQAEW